MQSLSAIKYLLEQGKKTNSGQTDTHHLFFMN